MWSRRYGHNYNCQLFGPNTWRQANVLSRRARGALGRAHDRRLLVVAATALGARRVVLRLLRRRAGYEHFVGSARAAVPFHSAFAVGRVGDELTVQARRARVAVDGPCGKATP